MVNPPTESTQRTESRKKGLNAALFALQVEADAVASLKDRLESDFETALDILSSLSGKVIVSGLGKSGLVGRKIAASLASTGSPSFFVHAAEALHGDAGMCSAEDVVMLISNSGETAEVCDFGRLLVERGVPIIAMTADKESSLGTLADAVLDISVEREADPLNLAPTASTTVTIAFGDALVSALMAMKGFGSEDFATNHPGGSLGRRLSDPVDSEADRR